MPQYHVGHVALAERIDRRVSEIPHFALAGNALHGVGIPFCVRSGERAAERIAANYSNEALASSSDRLSTEERLVLEAATSLQLADTAVLAVADESGARVELDQFLKRLHGLLRKAADAIDSEHFARQMPQHTFGPLR